MKVSATSFEFWELLSSPPGRTTRWLCLSWGTSYCDCLQFFCLPLVHGVDSERETLGTLQLRCARLTVTRISNVGALARIGI